MQEQLRQITQAVSLASGKQNTLDVIVSEVCKALDVEVCSIYLADYQSNQFVLMANRGLNINPDDQIRLDFNQGLVGLIGQREEPIHLHQANEHPAYHYLPNTREENLNAFLGVPIIHQRQVLGILVIQQQAPRHFEVEEETFLMTLAAQLSAILSNSEISELFEAEEDTNIFIHILRGTPASPGIAIGQARVIFPPEDIYSVPDRKTNDIAGELEKLGAAVRETHKQLDRMSHRMQGLVSEQELSLFDAYKQILSSKGLEAEITKQIEKGYWAPTALRIVMQQHLKAFLSMEDSYLRERANDIEDLANRVLAQLLSANNNTQILEDGTIIVAETVTAAMLAELPMDKVAGVISVRGSSTSHAAILAKALGIPTIMGLENFPIARIENRTLIVDGYNGQLYISPNKALINQFSALIEEEQQLSSELARDEELPNATKDGVNIKLMINSSISTDLAKAKKLGADGVGLFRTEIPFMQLDQFPSESTQSLIYRQLLEEFYDSPVTIRTLDIGGDKQLSYFPIKEENPFLGWRGIRVTLDHPEIFLVQLRAIFKASAGFGQLKLALPMVATLEELNECYRLINQAFDEVEEELLYSGKNITHPKVGIILEVPALLFHLSTFTKRVDFISVGTNDLIQYLMAVDRNNLQVKNLYSHFQPAVLNALKQVADECKASQTPIQVCGEMAADPLAALLLVGMGYYDLSMNTSSLAKVKRAISRFELREMQQMVETITTFETEAKIKNYLLKVIEKRGLGGLVRAGI
ncbi:phosphoenolpyruvate--protein phosphotransferase [Aliikangiella sp. IMCC44359]|uniref:phosphoenolpyruvate--protein phosphotransferase n=1 Tax=Aliikangiella sp. IMCC44359 TaxID=3459125 RepID=UPI00403AB46A